MFNLINLFIFLININYLSIFLFFSLINLSENVFFCKCNDHNKCLSSENKENDFRCVIKEKGHCFSARVVDIDDSTRPATVKIVKRLGCLSSADTNSILSCKGHFFNSTRPIAIDCCNKTNLCNEQLHPEFYHYNSERAVVEYVLSQLRSSSSATKQQQQKKSDKNLNINISGIMLTICVCVLLVCVSVCVAVVCYCRQRLHLASKQVLGSGGVSLIGRGGGRDESVLLQRGTTQHSHTATTGSLMTTSSLLTTNTTNLSYNNRLTQRTIGHQILFTQLLGQGRFSEVWAGDLLGEIVAVKHLHRSSQFKMLHETLWLRTVGLYYSYPVQHNYVASLLGSDNISPEVSIPCSLSLVLIYPYYHWGTLSRLMSSSHWDQTVTSSHSVEPNSRLETLSRMALSLVSGLCYLHTEIVATKGKPGIAHRNLKSSNIYVKDDYSCSIGDLEWAFVGDGKDANDRCNLESQILPQVAAPNGLIQIPDFEYYVSNVLFPTDCRYVAPELLDGPDYNNSRSYTLSSVEDFKKSDVYSLSLILWELLVWFEPSLKQTNNNLTSEEGLLSSSWIYEPAYQAELITIRGSQACDDSHLYDDPTLGELYNIVVTEKTRPSIDIRKLTSNECPSPCGSSMDIVKLLCQIIPQCWCPVPNSRLNSLKIKMYLSQFNESSSLNEEM